MSDDLNQGVAVPGEGSAPASPPPSVDNEPADRVEQGDHQQPAGDDTESRAKAMGWVPKEEFRGPPENWRDASEFVKRGEEDLPIVRERLRAATRKISELESNFNQQVARLEKMSETALKRQRDQLVGAYENAMRQAVETGDTQRYDQLRQDMGQAVERHDAQIREVAEPKPQQPARDPDADAWIQRNSWFNADREMQLVAVARSDALARERPGLSMRENLAEVERYVRSRYPDKFGASRAQPLNLEGGSRIANGGPRQKGASDLPADARAQGERFVKQGLFKNISEYASDYWAQDQ